MIRRKVLLLAPYPLRSTPSQRFRFEQYLAPLAADGFDIDVRSFLDPPAMKIFHKRGHLAGKMAAVIGGALRRLRDLVGAKRYDVVFVHREAFPLGYPILERLLAALGRPYVFDFDDAIFLTHTTSANRFIAPFKFARKTAEIVRHARLVIAGNTYLADWARRHQEQVTIIPTTIDTDLYRQRTTKTNGRLCVGWSGSVTTIAYFRTIEGVLRDLQREFGVRLRVIGDASYRLAGAEVESLPWREETEVDDISEIDIGVMPVPDEEWARGKCGLKGLQYMALGIPTVMSTVGVGPELASGGAAVLAGDERGWRDSIASLIRDVEARRAYAEAGRTRVVERYSVRANLHRYREVLESLS